VGQGKKWGKKEAGHQNSLNVSKSRHKVFLNEPEGAWQSRNRRKVEVQTTKKSRHNKRGQARPSDATSAMQGSGGPTGKRSLVQVRIWENVQVKRGKSTMGKSPKKGKGGCAAQAFLTVGRGTGWPRGMPVSVVSERRSLSEFENIGNSRSQVVGKVEEGVANSGERKKIRVPKRRRAKKVTREQTKKTRGGRKKR